MTAFPRRMTGFFASLTDAQKRRALEYRGPDDFTGNWPLTVSGPAPLRKKRDRFGDFIGAVVVILGALFLYGVFG